MPTTAIAEKISIHLTELEEGLLFFFWNELEEDLLFFFGD
jgi:hypothetical protein